MMKRCKYYRILKIFLLFIQNQQVIMTSLYIYIFFSRLSIFSKLFIIMGLSWFAEFVALIFTNYTPVEVWYFIDCINGLQGLFIFIVYVCKKDTLKLITKRLRPNQERRHNQEATISVTKCTSFTLTAARTRV